ncbi:MAG: glycosyltransferase family 2 protein [Thermoanaerobaculia bacterium]|nr:glycosyltransferase family 2 protein [Thermoanaerobaculia bacterium]
MPCLNEADTLEACIGAAQASFLRAGLRGEVVVADNGSIDGSQSIATRLGARLVDVPDRGYGAALMAGIAAAHGELIVMGDADDSYDFSEVPAFVEKLREGYDLVQGCRLPSGGGRVEPGAMPLLHRYWGNPMFSRLARWWYTAPIHDVYCGLRGFTRSLFLGLDQRCTGMEFAVEMIVKASLQQARIAEIPITLRPDGRISRRPHLKTFRDGWRTLRFFLLSTPRWLFLVPGIVLVVLGLLGYAIALPGLTIGTVTFDAHTLLFASLALLCGFQAIVFAILAKTFAVMERLLPEDPVLNRFFSWVDLERGIAASAVALAVGLALLLLALEQWRQTGFGPLDYARTMRLVIPGSTLTALGFQALLSSFLVSILSIRRW